MNYVTKTGKVEIITAPRLSKRSVCVRSPGCTFATASLLEVIRSVQRPDRPIIREVRYHSSFTPPESVSTHFCFDILFEAAGHGELGRRLINHMMYEIEEGILTLSGHSIVGSRHATMDELLSAPRAYGVAEEPVPFVE